MKGIFFLELIFLGEMRRVSRMDQGPIRAYRVFDVRKVAPVAVEYEGHQPRPRRA